MKIFLIRHGQSTGDVEDRYGGDYDDPLTAHGQEQVGELISYLQDKNIEIVYTSPRKRAEESARIICRGISCPKRISEDLRERNAYGVLTGLTKEEALKKYPAEVAKLQADFIRHTVKDSEKYEIFMARILAVLEKLMLHTDFHSMGIMTHDGAIHCFMREYLKMELAELGDCAVIELKNEDGKFSLVKMHNAKLK